MTVPSKREVLSQLSFGARVAEDEREGLSEYFVETDQWTKVVAGDVDVIFGAKGAGKSAIFTSLVNRTNEFRSRKIELISAEKPRGSTVFQGLVAAPPTSELEFTSIWKLYILSLVGSVIVERDVKGAAADKVRTALFEEGLLEGTDAPLATRFRSVWDWIKATLARISPEGEMKLDPAGQMTGVSFKLSLSEPSAQQRRDGAMSIDDLLASANSALAQDGQRVWVLFDRLDVAFSESRELEANGIRALFKAYLDLNDLDQIGIKIFLRTDIWDEITSGGFREASHITRQLRIDWSNESLLNLVVRRTARNERLLNFLGTATGAVLASAAAQRATFDRIVPVKVDVGRNPLSFEWILGRAQDGTKKPAPREVIHLLNEARDSQMRMLERGEAEPPAEELLSRAALREALGPVSKIRLEQTVYAEYPVEKPWIQVLEGGRTEHTAESLASLWEIDQEQAKVRAQRLIDIGFIEPRTSKGDPTYWVPFLYRPALNLRQGAA